MLTENLFRALLDAQTDLVSIARPDGTIVHVNAAFARHVGRAASELVRSRLYDHVAADDRAAVRSSLADMASHGVVRYDEVRMSTSDGSERWVEWVHDALAHDRGWLVHSVGRDITERKRSVREDETFIKKITDSLPVRIAYVDRELRYRFVNQAHCQRFGRSQEEIIGSTREALLGRPTPAPIDARIQAVLSGQAQRFEYEEDFEDGTHRIEVQLVPDTGPDGQTRGYFYTGLDITDRSRAEQSLRALTLEAQRQSDVLRLVTEAIPATVVVIGADGKYRFVNSAFETLCGLPREQIIGRDTIEVLGPTEVERRRPFMARAMAGESVSFTLDQEGPQGVMWLELTCIPLRLNGGPVDGLVGISQDITQQMRERDRLTELSLRDPLTGLLNRAGFDRSIDQMSAMAAGATLGLLYIDLDRFKPVNDAYGHSVGDRLLQSVAQRLEGLVRPTDAVARLGGDEFAVLLGDMGALRNVERVAEKVVEAIGAPFDIDGRSIRIGASVGVVFDDAQRCDRVALLGRADANLYRAKLLGKGRACS